MMTRIGIRKGTVERPRPPWALVHDVPPCAKVNASAGVTGIVGGELECGSEAAAWGVVTGSKYETLVMQGLEYSPTQTDEYMGLFVYPGCLESLVHLFLAAKQSRALSSREAFSSNREARRALRIPLTRYWQLLLAPTWIDSNKVTTIS
jgi:hypothetical protein